MPGTLDQACICFSMPLWVDQLATCKDEESFKTTYQSFLDTTWQALQGLQQCMRQFPYLRPTEAEAIKAYYMKNRTLILHNQIVWGKEADDDRPVIPSQEEQSHQDSSRRDEASSTQDKRGRSGDHDEDDPNERKSNANPPSKGDEAQDQEKKEDEKEATAESGEKGQTAAEREALEKVRELKRKLKEASRKAAEDKAQRTGEELAQEVDDERARKEKKREAKREKKRRKKQKRDGPEGPPSGDDDDDDESDNSDEKEEEEEKPEGESKEKGNKPTTEEDKKPEGEDKTKDKSGPEGEEAVEKSEEGPPKDEEPAESWAEVLRKARKPRQVITRAAEKARARTYPRPMCEVGTKPNNAYARAQHVPTKEPLYSGRCIVHEKPKDVQKRNPVKLIPFTRQSLNMEQGNGIRTLRSVY